MSPFRLMIAAAFLLGIYENYKKIRKNTIKREFANVKRKKNFFS